MRKKPKSKRTPYSKARDDEKVSRNWIKARGLYNRGEYSVAVIRCGTCVELAVNFAVRQELVTERDLPLPFVDTLLRRANGLRNKYQNIFLPIMVEYEEHKLLKKLWEKRIDKINKERNSVVHSGEFRSIKVAKPVMEHTLVVLKEIMDLYEHSASLDDIET
jgi:HEPN domain-containing protein